MSKRSKIWFGIFLFSFLPYFYLTYVSIFGIEFSWFFSTELHYGHEAVLIALFFGCVIPVYPIAILFQCIYGFVNRKKLTKKQKQVTGVIIAFLIGVTGLACVGHLIREKLTIQINYKRDRVVIQEYLRENLGEELAADMEIRMPKEITHIYSVDTPLLEDSFSVRMHEETREVVFCSFEGDYIKEIQLNKKMGEYLSKQWGLPEDAKLDVRVADIDVKGYAKEELPQALFTTCDYRIDGMTMNYDSYMEDKVVGEITHFLLQFEKKEPVMNEKGFFKFYVCINGQNYANILALPSNENADVWKLHFQGYTDEKGTTIEDTMVKINLSESR